MKQKNTVAKVALDIHAYQTFEYIIPQQLQSNQLIGTRVLVPFRKGKKIGIILSIHEEPTISHKRLKTIDSSLDNEPVVTKDILELCQWASDYYQYPLGEVLFSALPTLLRTQTSIQASSYNAYQITDLGLTSLKCKLPFKQKECLLLIKELDVLSLAEIASYSIHTKTIHSLLDKGYIEPSIKLPLIPSIKHDFSLNSQQQVAYECIQKSLNSFQTFLLEGITGSGKTEVYMQVIANLLKQNKQTLLLVPEIGLTPQTIQRFANRFQTSIAAIHSGLSDKERLEAWQQAKHSHIKLIIGTRSAVFTPMPDLGLIIIDEEHDASFKQQDQFRYSARDVAIMRAKQQNIPIILGSATPSLESFYNAKRNRFTWLHLTERAGVAKSPKFGVIDLRKQVLHEGISKPLLDSIKIHLEAGNQVLLFINRRGYAPLLICHLCGYGNTCIRCSAHMTLHQTSQQLICHHCGSHTSIPTACPECKEISLKPLGYGTERIENVLREYFPTTSVIRMDRDTTSRKGTLEKMLKTIAQNKPLLLIGTQMIAKGHHFPHVTLVGILGADHGLYSPDFRALEKLGQMIVQVAGRAGRAEKPGEVLIQTYNPNHAYLQLLFHENYHSFANKLLQERLDTLLPPYTYQAIFRGEAHILHNAMHELNQIKKILEKIKPKDIELFGPMPAPMEKKSGKFRAQLLLQAQSRSKLNQTISECLSLSQQLKKTSKSRWHLEIDPIELS